MRRIEVLRTTTNSRTYKLTRRPYIAYFHGYCPYCPPNKGCNRYEGKKSTRRKSWKYYRKTQYKD